MGKIGLPIAVQYARKGNDVIGLDINPGTIEKINNGIEPFPGEKLLQKYLSEVLKNNKLSATLDFQKAIETAEVIVICIPLIINSSNEPDFTNIDSVVIQIAKFMTKNTLISFETTLPVGTTRNRFAKSISQISKFQIGIDFFVVFSPERVFTGRIFEDLAKYPKLVGGVTESCTEKGVEFYEKVLDFDKRNDLKKKNGVWALKNSETAEFAKIAETTYRDVNIGLANEFSQYALKKNVDFTEVVEAANSQPFSHIHMPGISVGGHCIPVYPHFYIQDNPDSEITKAARRRNSSMPQIAVDRIREKIGPLKGLNIGVFGISYRAGVKEVAFSGALDLLKSLNREEALVYGFDPFYSQEEIKDLGFLYTEGYENLDGIFIHTAHSEYSELSFRNLSKLKFILDGRNMIDPGQSLTDEVIYLNMENK
jgi:UDP-N-acetyl-D-glucosamine dehydrogenase